MICRLATCDNADLRVKEVINALNTKKYIYWGNNIAYDCDYLFVHSQGDSTIRGILKVNSFKSRKDIPKENFLINRPKDWETTLDFEKYFIIEGAKKVLIKIDDLKDAEGNPKKSNAMHEMSFVVWDKFQPF